MRNMTYDPEADAVYISIARGTVASTQEAGPFIYDVDGSGRILGVEVLTASKVLAPGEWQRARMPNDDRSNAAE